MLKNCFVSNLSLSCNIIILKIGYDLTKLSTKECDAFLRRSVGIRGNSGSRDYV